MKILAVSDIVNKKLYSTAVKEFAGDVDLIVSCGDLPTYYLDYLTSSLCKPLLYVCGNHDHYDLDQLEQSYSAGQGYGFKLNQDLRSGFGGSDIDEKSELIKGYLFSGLEGSFLYNKGEHQYTESQMRSKMRRLAPGLIWNRLRYGHFLDILVTHAPPRGIHDRDDLPHLGFQSYLSFIRKYKPRVLLHGHTHIYDRQEKRFTEYNGTKVINCYDYQIIELTNEDIKIYV